MLTRSDNSRAARTSERLRGSSLRKFHSINVVLFLALLCSSHAHTYNKTHTDIQRVPCNVRDISLHPHYHHHLSIIAFVYQCIVRSVLQGSSPDLQPRKTNKKFSQGADKDHPEL